MTADASRAGTAAPRVIFRLAKTLPAPASLAFCNRRREIGTRDIPLNATTASNQVLVLSRGAKHMHSRPAGLRQAGREPRAAREMRTRAENERVHTRTQTTQSSSTWDAQNICPRLRHRRNVGRRQHPVAARLPAQPCARCVRVCTRRQR